MRYHHPLQILIWTHNQCPENKADPTTHDLLRWMSWDMSIMLARLMKTGQNTEPSRRSTDGLDDASSVSCSKLWDMHFHWSYSTYMYFNIWFDPLHVYLTDRRSRYILYLISLFFGRVWVILKIEVKMTWLKFFVDTLFGTTWENLGG